MNAELYREIIEDSPMAYLHFKGIKRENKYIDIEIMSLNSSFAEYFKLEKEEINRELLLNLGRCVELDLDKVLKTTVIKKKLSLIKYMEAIDKNVKIDFYKGEIDEFHIRFRELPRDTIQMSKILKKSPFIAWIKNREGQYLDVNKTFIEYCNKSYEEIIGNTDYEVWPLDIAKIFEARDNSVLLNNAIEVYQEYLDINGGNKRYFQTAKWPYTDEDNLIIGTVGTSTEITDKIKLKESIRRNDEIFNEIAENIEDIIITLDEKKAIYVSPAFEKVFGLKADVLYEDLNALENNFTVEFLEEPNPFNHREITSHTFRVSNDDNFDKWFTCKFVPVFDENNNIIKKIGVMSDITKTIKLQDELDQLRLDFFANLSHELRTPINLILSCLEVLKLRVNNLSNKDREYYDKYLGIINQNGLRLLKLVNNLIDTTKIDSGHFSYNPTNYDIVSFIENICMSVSEFVNLNNMNIIFDTNEEEKIISFDLDNMERIILNLLSNAIKFNKENGNIEVTINCDENIEISVKDDGIGIPADTKENIFGRFEQAQNRIKKNAEGSGIGLSLVKSLVEIHGGSVEFKSEVDKGSEFIITLPDRLCEVENSIEKTSTYKNVNMMKVEFSDIYI